MRVLRLVIVLAQAATLLVTWQLWQPRESLPNLPLWDLPFWDLPQAHFGEVLLLSLALVIPWPRLGIALHLGLLAAAMLADQLREQPQVFSLAFLLLTTWPGAGLAPVARVHLSCLWLFSGSGKLLSERFLDEGGEWLASGLGLSGAGTQLAILVGAVELLVGALLWWPRLARTALLAGAALHAGIFLFLTSLGPDQGNVAVWPWNLALITTCLSLASDRFHGVRHLGRMGPLARVCTVLLMLLPLGYSAGVVDSMFSHRVYTLTHPVVIVSDTEGRLREVRRVRELHIALPTDPRIATAWFRATARPGEKLFLLEDRWLPPLLGSSKDKMVLP